MSLHGARGGILCIIIYCASSTLCFTGLCIEPVCHAHLSALLEFPPLYCIGHHHAQSYNNPLLQSCRNFYSSCNKRLAYKRFHHHKPATASMLLCLLGLTEVCEWSGGISSLEQLQGSALHCHTAHSNTAHAQLLVTPSSVCAEEGKRGAKRGHYHNDSGTLHKHQPCRCQAAHQAAKTGMSFTH